MHKSHSCPINSYIGPSAAGTLGFQVTLFCIVECWPEFFNQNAALAGLGSVRASRPGQLQKPTRH
eukprot:2649181-Amphidinium_carterae.1